MERPSSFVAALTLSAWSKHLHSLKTFVYGFGAALMLVCAALLTENSSQAVTKTTAPARGYYLTQDFWNGGQALNACVAGYHMASFWDIRETSNLRYDTALGLTAADAGTGPRTGAVGWIRTGHASLTNATVLGSNCAAYTSGLPEHNGTVASLTLGDGSNHGWGVAGNPCSFSVPVWCVQD